MSAAAVVTVPAARTMGMLRLGAFPAVALVASAGLVAVALANTLARASVAAAPLVWWLGLLLIVLPAAYRLLGRGADRGERLAIVVTVALALYLVKVLHGPGAFVMFDEFQHWATLQDINERGRLFTYNSILVASPYYPGVEVITDLVTRSGLGAWEAGVLVIGAARVLHALALFLLFERVSGQARVAGIGALIYMTNPSFLFFDAQFSYESVALPLATFVLWLVVRREAGPDAPAVPEGPSMPTGSGGAIVLALRTRRRPAGSALGLTVLALAGICAVAVTHHVSAIAMSGFLVAWAVIAVVLRWLRRPGRTDVAGLAVFSVIVTVAWMLYAAGVTVRYLAPAIGSTVNQVADLLGGDETGRELFRSATGVPAPFWEQALGYASVGVALLLLLLGLPRVWTRFRHHSAALALALVALVYPLTLVARLTVRGAELSARSAEFVFMGIGFVGAVGVVAVLEHTADPRSQRRRFGRSARGASRPADDRPVLTPVEQSPAPPRPLVARGVRVVILGGTLVLVMGGAILGIPAWARLPGPYLVSADPRSVEPLGLTTAAWTARWLGRDQTFLSDRTNRMLLKVYGGQHPITAAGDRIDVKDAYFDLAVRPWQLTRLSRVPVRYVIADRRLATSLPYVGVYVERGELTSEGPWVEPLPIEALDKWDRMDGVDRIYDAGDLRIFDIGGLTGAR